MPDKDFSFDDHAFANESVARNLAAFANPGSFLNLDEGANFRLIADLATVKIYESLNSDVSAELNIRRYQLMLMHRPSAAHTAARTISLASDGSDGTTTSRDWENLIGPPRL